MAIAGLGVGHASLGDTGCTVIAAPESAIAAVDVRGGGPGTRETDLLDPSNTVQRVHAVVLTGGSAFGLATADGAMRALEEKGIGFPVLGEGVPGPIVPIVPAAVIFDLLVGDPNHRPSAQDGYQATLAALAATTPGSPVQAEVGERGTSIGAGSAATAGVLRGGFGQAAVKAGDFTVAAGVVANPVGSVIDPASGALWADPHGPRVDLERFAELKPLGSKLNTTIGVVATDAPVSKAQAKRLAMTGHDGIAVAVRPAHSPLDGDTLFCLSTGDGSGVGLEEMIALSRASAEAVAGAIVDAVSNARADFGLESFSSLLL